MSEAIQRARTSFVEISRFWRPSINLERKWYCSKAVRRVDSSLSKHSHRHFHVASYLSQQSENSIGKKEILDKFKTIFNSSHQRVSAVRNVINSFDPSKISPDEKEIVIEGYLGTRSDLSKNLSFASLKDVSSEDTIQIVSSPPDTPVDVHQTLKSARPFEPIKVTGILRPKFQPKKKIKDDSSSNESSESVPELSIREVLVLNSLSSDVVLQDGADYGPEQRALRLRTDPILRAGLELRSKIMRFCERRLADRDSVQIETPLLFKSTSEGANEYLVPTRRKGLAYALPQSPQQFKQILMASGVANYHQLARCFRDEDLRADRQPEFTQLDIERSFTDGSHIRSLVTKSIIIPMWQEFLGVKLSTKDFRGMTYDQAMLEYGSDKPDLRIPFKIHPSIQSILPPDLVSKISPLVDPIVDALVIPLEAPPEQVREFIAQYLDSDDASTYHGNPDGGPGIFVYDFSKPLQGLSAFGFSAVESISQTFGELDDGHLIILQARKNEPLSGGSTELGRLRIALHTALVDACLLPPLPWRYFELLWVFDFPLFSPSTADEPGQGGKTGFKSTHHPFTSPKTAADVDMLLSDPTKAIGDHYDLVINGEEIGGGSRRIHHAAMQELIFRDVLKMDEEKIAEFAPLLEALRAACPPHSGIALGFDRLVAMVYSHIIGKKVSMRDVIAFPKTGSGDDPMMRSPGRMSEEQLERYHLKLRD